VHIGCTTTGIGTFTEDGSFSTLRSGEGLPCDGILGLARLDDWLFCLVGYRDGGANQGLVGVSMDTGKAHTVLSMRQAPGTEEKNYGFLGLAADPGRDVVWFLTHGRYAKSGRSRNRLYSYAPRTAEMKHVSTPELDKHMPYSTWFGPRGRLRMSGNRLLIYGIEGLIEFNVNTQQTRLLTEQTHTERRGKWSEPWTFFLPEEFAATADGLACIAAGKLVLFRDGSKDAFVYPATTFRPSDPQTGMSLAERKRRAGTGRAQVLDLTPTSRGLYVLTSEMLWLIPEIRSVSNEEEETL